jgi:hypothetical protein
MTEDPERLVIPAQATPNSATARYSLRSRAPTHSYYQSAREEVWRGQMADADEGLTLPTPPMTVFTNPDNLLNLSRRLRRVHEPPQPAQEEPNFLPPD